MISIPGRDWASFLEDLNIIRRIVALAEPAGDETIVEIGAGLGFMTEELAKRADRVIAIEVDPRLAAILRERFTGQVRVEVVQMDVLKCDFSPACPGKGQGRRQYPLPYFFPDPFSSARLSSVGLVDDPDAPEGTGIWPVGCFQRAGGSESDLPSFGHQ